MRSMDKHLFGEFINFDFESRHKNATNIFLRLILYIQIFLRNRKYVKILKKTQSRINKLNNQKIHFQTENLNQLSKILEQILELFVLRIMFFKENNIHTSLGNYYIESCEKLQKETLKFQQFLDMKITGIAINQEENIL